MTHTTIDSIIDLTALEMLFAKALPSREAYKPDHTVSPFESWVFDYTAAFPNYSKQNFSFEAAAGGYYVVISSSFFDPRFTSVYDSSGNAIADDNGTTYGSDAVGFVAPYAGRYYISTSWEHGLAAANQGGSITVFEDADYSSTVAPAPVAPIAVADNIIIGVSGNDKISVTAGKDVINGGDGLDTVLVAGLRAEFTVSKIGDVILISDKSGKLDVDAAINVERLQFSDSIVSFEKIGAAAQAYRLYAAAFDRTPDAGGLGFWVGSMEKGIPLKSAAESFVTSTEFKALYGVAPSNEQVLTALYKNVLHRAPDQGGYNYWIGLLNGKAATTADMLVSFSESAENQTQVVGSLNAGFDFIY